MLYGQVSEYTSTQIKLVYYSNPTTTVNLIYNAFTEIYGCTDATADNYNEGANCDDGSCNYCINNDCTYVPDDNFEAYLEANGMGNGKLNDDYVTTSNINGVTQLIFDGFGITDLTGIEDFSSLTSLDISHHILLGLDLSNNTALVSLVLNGDINGFSQLTSLDVSMLTDLISLTFTYSSISDIDLSNNTALTFLGCWGNKLTSLDVRNGNNTNFQGFYCGGNLNLNCINVDNVAWSTENWTNIPPQSYFCN